MITRHLSSSIQLLVLDTSTSSTCTVPLHLNSATKSYSNTCSTAFFSSSASASMFADAPVNGSHFNNTDQTTSATTTTTTTTSITSKSSPAAAAHILRRMLDSQLFIWDDGGDDEG